MTENSEQKPRKKLLRSIILSIILFAAIGSASFYLFVTWQQFLESPIIPVNSQLTTIIKPGATIKQIANKLYNRGYLQHPQFLILFTRLTGNATKIKAGEYQFEGGITPRQFIKKLIEGDIVHHRFTIIEGWTFRKVLMALASAKKLQFDLSTQPVQEVIEKLGIEQENPEGLFFPETYQYPMATKATDILQRAYQSMQKKLNEAWETRANNLPYKTPYAALIVASMIEKETAVENERPLIAEVIINRLRKKMYLQIDPTVIYGLGDRLNGELTSAGLRIDTPYNTYRHKGLPPTPIGMPSEASIQAAVHPEEGKLLYFVAKGDGSHYFSATLKDHDKAVKKYLLDK